VRAWDLAATEAKPGRDPDWTAGALVGRDPQDGRFWILDVRRARATPQGVERLVLSTAEQDGWDVQIVIEEEPGSAGKALSQRYARLLAGFETRFERPTGDKATRAAPLSSQAEAGRVVLVRGPWLGAFLDEVEAFPCGSHDDQVDAVSMAYGKLAQRDTAYDDAMPFALESRGGDSLSHRWESRFYS
jgi:predicted phage terminase large subunit-like protein